MHKKTIDDARTLALSIVGVDAPITHFMEDVMDHMDHGDSLEECRHLILEHHHIPENQKISEPQKPRMSS